MAYEFDGNKYEQASSHQREWGETLIGALSLKGNERVLDLGCGDGTLTAMIAELVPEGDVLGIDSSRGMIATALSKNRENLRFQLLDIEKIDFENEFDIIFSNAALHWIKNHETLLANVRRSLRPAGLAWFNFAGHGNCAALLGVMREAMGHQRFKTYFTSFEWPWYMPEVEEYAGLARSIGFERVTVWSENADRYFRDRETMVRWIDQPSIVPFLHPLPQSRKTEFRYFVVNRMIEKTLQADGTCFETFRRINLRATK